MSGIETNDITLTELARLIKNEKDLDDGDFVVASINKLKTENKRLREALGRSRKRTQDVRNSLKEVASSLTNIKNVAEVFSKSYPEVVELIHLGHLAENWLEKI